MTRYLLAFAVLLGGCSAITPPPALSPDATVAYQNTRVIKALDILRDTAIAAHEQSSSLLSEEATRNVVMFHQTALKIIEVLPVSWQSTVHVSLEQLTERLLPRERQQLGPYLALLDMLLKEVR